jgi:SAM-dependent methyltransferase
MKMPIHCPLCRKDHILLVSEKLRYESPRRVYGCDDCRLVFLYPGMTPEEERIFYEKEYGEIFSNEKGTTPAKLFESRLPDARMYADWVREYLGPADSCLELGCASGYFLATIRDRVSSVSGIEKHRLLNEYCKKIGICTYESPDECKDNQFDRIFMFFLLEHIGDPVSFLSAITRVLKKGGTLFIIVPNVEDALLTLYDIPAFKSYYYTPAHQFYYSKDTLRQMLKSAGLENVSIYPKQRYDLSNHMHWMIYGKPGGIGRYNSIFSPALLSEYAECLMDKFLCDTLFAVVTKPDH